MITAQMLFTNSHEGFEHVGETWLFPKLKVPQNGWWKSWKTLWTNGWFGGYFTPYFWFNSHIKTPIFQSQQQQKTRSHLPPTSIGSPREDLGMVDDHPPEPQQDSLPSPAVMKLDTMTSCTCGTFEDSVFHLWWVKRWQHRKIRWYCRTNSWRSVATCQLSRFFTNFQKSFPHSANGPWDKKFKLYFSY